MKIGLKSANLPVGTYSGSTLVGFDCDYENKPVSYPFTAMLVRNGALSGSIMLFCKQATLKASGYDFLNDYGQYRYNAILDLKAIDKSWGALTVKVLVWLSVRMVR